MIPPQFPVVEDVTGTHQVPVWAIVAPKTLDEIAAALARTEGPISIGGGRFSMGGQTASFGSLHIDMRAFNKVINFAPLDQTIRVQAGIRWRDLQRFIDPHDLAVRIMPPYANFTVGGTLAVNAHGRELGLGPVVHAVRSVRVVLADGRIEEASREHNAELFHALIGSFGALGVIVEAEIELVPNGRLQRQSARLSRSAYFELLRSHTLTSEPPVFHQADFYGPSFERVRATTWVETEKWVTHEERIHSSARPYPLHRYLIWAVGESRLSHWRREFIIDPTLFGRSAVHWRNFEASADVSGLEPRSRQQTTYLLQEYFIPIHEAEAFLLRLREILACFKVRAVHLTLNHVGPDRDSLLAWARGDTLAFKLYVKQRLRDSAASRVAVWTRELIDAAIAAGGGFHLPYRIDATVAQFRAAFPTAPALFALKRRIDPAYRFRNSLWDTYYEAPTDESGAPLPDQAQPFGGILPPVDVRGGEAGGPPASTLRQVLAEPTAHDLLYRHLQTGWRERPAEETFALLHELAARQPGDEAVYRSLLALYEHRPRRFRLPRHWRIRREERRQLAERVRTLITALPRGRAYEGLLDIGSQGRHGGLVTGCAAVRSPLVTLDQVAPTHGLAEWIDRGGPSLGVRYVPTTGAASLPIDLPEERLASAAFDLVLCFEGLHGLTPEQLDRALGCIVRVLRPEGLLLLRVADAPDEAARRLAGVAAMLRDASMGRAWDYRLRDADQMREASEWSALLAAHGLTEVGPRVRDERDPTAPTLMAFMRG